MNRVFECLDSGFFPVPDRGEVPQGLSVAGWNPPELADPARSFFAREQSRQRLMNA